MVMDYDRAVVYVHGLGVILCGVVLGLLSSKEGLSG